MSPVQRPLAQYEPSGQCLTQTLCATSKATSGTSLGLTGPICKTRGLGLISLMLSDMDGETERCGDREGDQQDKQNLLLIPPFA